MKLEIEDLTHTLDSSTQDLLLRCAEASAAAECIRLPLSVYVRVTGDEEIHEINLQTRGIDRATDVLSFPTVRYPDGKTAGCCEALVRKEWDPESQSCMIGDILISIDHVREQAREYGHSEHRELGYLLTHAMMHLFGYDHMTPEEKKRMRSKEEDALKIAGLPREKEITI